MYTLYSDGGKSPKNGTYGSFRLENAEGLLINLKRLKFHPPIDTNNTAEYASLLAGLRFCQQEDIKHVQCYTDSNLLVQQINKNWKINKKTLRDLAEEIWETLQSFDEFTIEYTKRKNIVSKLGH